MRLLIYLLAMLSGFSAAEAARPVSSAPASMGSAVAQTYVVTAAHEVAQAYAIPVRYAEFSRLALVPAPGIANLLVLAPNTPICRHDIILR